MRERIQRVRKDEGRVSEEIRGCLGDWNAGRVGIADEEAVVFEVRDEGDGALVAGVVATVWGRVVEVEFLWVCEAAQGRGLGTELMAAVEGVARERGCERMATQTYSFQAPGFYEKLGFRERMVLEGFPEGVEKVFLVKELGEGG